MVEGEVLGIMQSLEDPGVRRGLFRLDTEKPDFRKGFQDRVRSLDADKSTALFRAILGRVVRDDERRYAYNRNSNERNAAVGILPMLNLALIDPEVLTLEFVSSVDTLTERIDNLPHRTERARELLDVGEILSPYFLRTPEHVATLSASCNALADKMTYQHFYRNPHYVIDDIVRNQADPVTIVDFQENGDEQISMKQNLQQGADIGTKIIATITADPSRKWKVKDLAEELGLTKIALTAHLHRLRINLSGRWTSRELKKETAPVT